jgi:CheY-like chemotaxis protein
VTDASPGSDHQLLRVLLVHDGALEARLTEELLRCVPGRCYVIERVRTAAKAIERLRTQDHDVCLCDWHLGTQTGTDVLAFARDEDLATPIVILKDRADTTAD